MLAEGSNTMGAWAYGPFDNDTAFHLEGQVRESLTRWFYPRTNPDELVNEQDMVNRGRAAIEMMCALERDKEFPDPETWPYVAMEFLARLAASEVFTPEFRAAVRAQQRRLRPFVKGADRVVALQEKEMRRLAAIQAARHR